MAESSGETLDLYRDVLPSDSPEESGGWTPSPVLIRNLGAPDFAESQPTQSLEPIRAAPPPPPGSQDLLQLDTEEETQTLDVGDTPPVPRRGFERFDFSSSVVRAQIWHNQKSTPKPGRVKNGSVSGMWVQTSHPLPFRSYLTMEWVVGEQSMAFSGRVVRATSDGMAVHLSTDDSDWRFRAAFVDTARTSTGDLPQVIIRAATPEECARHEQTQAEISELAELWSDVEQHLNEEEAHQAFIHACLRVKRTEFALERYRELKKANPHSEAIDRYLQQIGTILSFYTLPGRGEGATTEKSGRSKLYIITLVIIATVLALSAALFTASRKRTRSATAPTFESPPPLK